MDIFVYLFLVVCLITLAVFSGAETAFFSLSSMQIRSLRKSPDKKKQKIGMLLESPRDLLVSFIIVIIVMSLLVQSAISILFAEESSWGLNVFLPLGLNLILGEVIPKSLAMPSNMTVAYKTVFLVQWAQKILLPIRKVLTGIASFAIPILFFFLHREKEISLPELQHALKESKDRGVLLPEESEMIRGYLHLQESMVKDLMRPREEVIYFDIEETISRLVHLFVDQECTRIPVCVGGLDQVKGIITSGSFFLHREEIAEGKDLMAIIKVPYFVPETVKADQLLKQMYEKKELLAFVVNEYGTVTGIISMEDLVEEVIGEIVDRRDKEPFFSRSSKEEIIASGKLELAEFEDVFGIPLRSETHRVTLGGWLIEQMGDIPKPGAKYQTRDFFFQVLAADPTRILRIYVRKFQRVKK